MKPTDPDSSSLAFTAPAGVRVPLRAPRDQPFRRSIDPPAVRRDDAPGALPSAGKPMFHTTGITLSLGPADSRVGRGRGTCQPCAVHGVASVQISDPSPPLAATPILIDLS